MSRFFGVVGLLMVFGTGLSPAIAQWLWDDPFMAMQAWWFKPMIFTGIGLMILSSIFGTSLGQRKIKTGMPAVGVVQSIQQTGTYINEQPEVRMALKVSRQGRDTYDTELRTIIPLTSLSQFQPGAIIPLVVSEKDERKVGLDQNGMVSQEYMQQLLNEKMTQQGIAPEMVDIARTGEKALAKVLDVTPMGSGHNGNIKLQLKLSITKPNGETFEVTTQKEILPSALPQVQQGHIINVFYSKQDPSKVALALQVQEEQLNQLFSS
ncbi:hypothetical protein PAECIP112173_02527 [Paenibacillus sp. JJ-100]|uniref:hypothetical protein n=1 Tax=Paenibacillus sp. JJ-100 TaxID=2974896 RepID=UPI0022FF638B|nr:hypothetical protein [Paenibacillus sp. JJ-100]CAI6078106.1 hypothetical protein PAECIP112173_02527 [Paenibacillus sp. JJ-100]